MVSIEGDLVQLEYRSPHSWIHVNAKDDTGVMRQVAAEWASAPRLKQWGVSEETLKPGDHVIISGSPSRDPSEYRMHLKAFGDPPMAGSGSDPPPAADRSRQPRKHDGTK